MHFAHHADGFYAQWGRRYLDPREAPWKSLLDYWIADEYHLGRAALLITIGKHQRIWHDIPKRARYARRCIRTFEDLHIKHAATPPNPDTLAEPLFNNWRFDIPIDPVSCSAAWSHNLQTSQLIDLLDPSNAPYTDHQWEYFFFTMAPERFRNRSRAYEWVAERRAELATIRDSVPPELLQSPPEDPHLVNGAYVGVFRHRGDDIKWGIVQTNTRWRNYHP